MKQQILNVVCDTYLVTQEQISKMRITPHLAEARYAGIFIMCLAEVDVEEISSTFNLTFHKSAERIARRFKSDLTEEKTERLNKALKTLDLPLIQRGHAGKPKRWPPEYSNISYQQRLRSYGV